MDNGLYLTLMMGQLVPEPVSRDVVEALKSVQISVNSGQRSGFQMTFTVGRSSPINTSLLPNGFFDPLQRVILIVTVNGSSDVVMDGIITRQDVAASNQPGQSTLTVTGEDLSRVMDLIDFSGFPFPAMPAEARVALMIAKYAVYGLIPLIIPSVFLDVPIPTDKIHAQQGTDFSHINELANQVGYVFYVETTSTPGANVAYWGPEVKTGAPQPALTVDMDTETNVESMSFSYDGLSRRLPIIFIQNELTKFPLPIPVLSIDPLNPPLAARPPLPLKLEMLKDTAKMTPLQAAAIGLATAARSAEATSASGQVDVLRYGRVLKARQLVGVRGAGRAYDGLYFVRGVTHHIARGTYTQDFTLSRNGLNPTVDQVGL
jgi:hypothetical protein